MTQRDESDFWAPRWEVEIERNGMWPLKWAWRVSYVCHRDHQFHSRNGDARTKEKALRRAAAARVSIERDDLSWREVEGEAIQ